MRILHTSDWHLGKSLEQINRLEEQREFIDFLCTTVEEQKIDIVLVAGDVFDTYNPSAAAEELFYEAIDRLSGMGRRGVIVIAGNHDSPERLCAASPLAFRNGIILLGYPKSDAGEYSNFGGSIRLVASGPGWLELWLPNCEHNAVILTLPYPSEARLAEVLVQQADEEILQKAYSDKIASLWDDLSRNFRSDTVNLAVGHLFLMGGKQSDSERTLEVGGAMTVASEVMPAKAHYVALGHLHRPQQIKSAPCPTYYSGSPMAYSFSEAGYSKAVFLIEAVPGQEAEITPIYLSCGKPLCRWVAEEGIAQALQWCEEGRDSNAWVDLELVTDRVLTSEEQKQLRALHPGIINIRPRLKTEATEVSSPESREGKKIDELFTDFYEYRMGTEIPNELLQAFLEVLNEAEDETADELEEAGEAVEFDSHKVVFHEGGASDATEAS
jgi:exonuclease SbcD